MKYLTGFLMAVADTVPGVSGSTIAFILGEYDKFIFHLHNLKSSERKESIFYLGKLGMGWLVGFILAIFLISHLVEQNIYATSSLFIGFILASIPVTIMTEKVYENFSFKSLLMIFLGFILVFSISYFGVRNVSIDLEGNYILMYLYIFVCGFFAITAMLLPGISGSTVMTIFGVYFVVIETIKEVLLFNFEDIFILISLGLGIIVGIVIMSGYINNLFNNHRKLTISFVLGMMIASIYSLIISPLSVDLQNEIVNFENLKIFMLIFGFSIIILLDFFSTKNVFFQKNNK